MSFLIKLIKNIIALSFSAVLFIVICTLAILGAVLDALENIRKISNEEFRRVKHYCSR